MPWRENCAMDQRVGFISDYNNGVLSMSELCEAYDVSRQTGYKWLRRYRTEGVQGLAERSHAPRQHGLATAPELIAAIEEMRIARPSWGPRKIIAKLQRDWPECDWPAASTAGAILQRAGLVSARRERRRAPPRLGELTVATHVNQVWRVDHKGWIKLGDGARLEPLTMTDGFSRYLLCVSASTGTHGATACPYFREAFETYGLPEIIRSDNGTPFASAGVTGLTQLSVWWTKLGIRHERIDAGSPQQNGSHERFHRTLLEAMTPPAASMAEQQCRFAAFQHDYNYERPHEALGQRPPADFYQAATRRLPRHLPEPVYPSEVAARRVRGNGEIKWRGDLIFISTALVGEIVGVEETELGEWRVRFFDVPLGIIDQSKQKLRPLIPKPRDKRAEMADKQ